MLLNILRTILANCVAVKLAAVKLAKLIARHYINTCRSADTRRSPTHTPP